MLASRKGNLYAPHAVKKVQKMRPTTIGNRKDLGVEIVQGDEEENASKGNVTRKEPSYAWLTMHV